jgi:hypothetical protein
MTVSTREAELAAARLLLRRMCVSLDDLIQAGPQAPLLAFAEYVPLMRDRPDRVRMAAPAHAADWRELALSADALRRSRRPAAPASRCSDHHDGPPLTTDLASAAAAAMSPCRWSSQAIRRR